MADPRDLARLRLAADALGELTDECVFVGGSVTSLLLTDPASPGTRLTEDVDVIVDVVTRKDYYAVEEKLRRRGFEQRTDDQAPICRWFHGTLMVDVMPLNETILGFSNRWYGEAFRDSMPFDIGPRTINVVRPIWFLATKLAAFEGRGQGDYQASRDIEDIVAVVDGRRDVLAEFDDSAEVVRSYLGTRFRELLTTPLFVVAVDGHLGGEQGRTSVVLARLGYLAGRRGSVD